MMKVFRRMLFLFIVCQLSFYAFSQTTTAAEIRFDTTFINFGEVEYDSKLIVKFAFKNTGNAPLIISSVRGSDGGLMAKSWPRNPIPPGGSSFIEVIYDTRRVGPVNRSLNVTSNGSGESSIEIRVKGKVLPRPPDNSIPHN